MKDRYHFQIRAKGSLVRAEDGVSFSYSTDPGTVLLGWKMASFSSSLAVATLVFWNLNHLFAKIGCTIPQNNNFYFPNAKGAAFSPLTCLTCFL